MPSSRFQPLHPRASLRRLRTAFSPSTPTSPSTASTTSSSPLSSGTRASSNFTGFDFDFGNLSAISLSQRPHSSRVIRRKKSMAEVEQEEERSAFSNELVALIEPRPSAGTSLGGIEEVLEGRI